MYCSDCGEPISMDTGYAEYEFGCICLKCDAREPSPNPPGWDYVETDAD